MGSFHKSASCWQTQKAKAEFSKLLRASQEKGDQIITCRDEPVAVLVSKRRYDQLVRKESSLLEFFQNAPLPNVDLPAKRRKDLPRQIPL
jgi:prevent-host-death family protein